MPLHDAARCFYCQKPLYGGRTDRKFCNDTCRNAANRERRKMEAAMFGDDIQEKIFKILKKNHALMLKFNKTQDCGKIVDREKIYLEGFDFTRFTSAESAGPNRLRRFCFEQYWEDLDNGLIELGVDESKISGL
jgi:hypothetical protein